ncbi:MAG: putative cytochrome c1 signal peptide protein [Hydrocarboniphaga sp.]|uniref:hypothetical protein n=1 Tax=Hydrocarboniphaga sp. TaxID=2033016 RepID=UPI002607F516|nr:hypothetical protein [Hydrocarboniphaga sp.]MDB5972554.1 putative cytochrome c1 signal peptide protein [Hydrocarboniphaga sp.]
MQQIFQPQRTLGRLLMLVLLSAASSTASALPSFARQTGEDCAACHVGGIGPQLTPHGTKFKIGGYTDGDNAEKFWVPMSGQAITTSTHTSKDQPGGAAPGYKANDNTIFQEGSVFLAGRFAPHVGGFVQGTYSGVDHAWSWDNVDLRAALPLQLGGGETTFGVSLNNSPSTQDPFNTLPSWSFPYVSSDLTPGYLGEPLLAGGLGQLSTGLTGYAYINEWVYAEAGAYRDLPGDFLSSVGVPREDRVNLDGAAPYWRLHVGHEFKHQYASLGLFGLDASIQPDPGAGAKDQYRDIGIDGTYQFIGTHRNIFSVNARYIREKQDLNATVAEGGAERNNATLTEYNFSASYYYLNTYGFTVGAFGTGGDTDQTLYAAADIEGSRTGKPDTQGTIWQIDYTPWGKEASWMAPWANLRLALQYTAYSQFNGASSDYDGAGRDASDNNTLMAFAWLAF